MADWTENARVNKTSVATLNPLLRTAVKAGRVTAVHLRIDRGDDLNARDDNGMTPLMLAATENKPTICNLLLAAGADYHLLNSTGKTAYEIAAAAGASETAAVLDAYATMHGIQTKDDRVGRFESIPEAKEVQEAEAVGPDLSEWEPESESVLPETDPSVLASAHVIQREITAHKFLNGSLAEWESIDRHPLPKVRIDDVEVRDQFRQLVLRMMQRGQVRNLDEQELNAFLDKIVNDLGVKAVDEGACPRKDIALSEPVEGNSHSANKAEVSKRVIDTDAQEPFSQALRKPGDPIVSAKLSLLDHLLADATELGIQFDDDRSGSSGHIWVKLLDESDLRRRSFARRLLDSGFEFWPGEGYWK